MTTKALETSPASNLPHFHVRDGGPVARNASIVQPMLHAMPNTYTRSRISSSAQAKGKGRANDDDDYGDERYRDVTVDRFLQGGDDDGLPVWDLTTDLDEEGVNDMTGQEASNLSSRDVMAQIYMSKSFSLLNLISTVITEEKNHSTSFMVHHDHRDYLILQTLPIFASLDTQLLHHIINGNLARARRQDPHIQRTLMANRMKGNSQPAIYLQLLVNDRGFSPTPAELTTVLEVMLRGGYSIEQFVIFHIFSPHQAVIAEIMFTRLAQGYIKNGGGFSHYLAGRSNHSAQHISELDWAKFRKEVYEKTAIGDAIARESKRLDAIRILGDLQADIDAQTRLNAEAEEELRVILAEVDTAKAKAARRAFVLADMARMSREIDAMRAHARLIDVLEDWVDNRIIISNAKKRIANLLDQQEEEELLRCVSL
ncbi:MAG: hypothetical protein M1835_002145 [Candelina submexicana]|nr:MAG: hypothetical protein M1835_002145 [Candelina submexicana]